MTIVLWFAVPARRQVIIWTLAVFVSATAALSGVFTSFISINDLSWAISLTNDLAGGRYLLPMLLAWFATIMTLFFMDQPSPVSTPGTSETVARTKL
jgi:NADH:ubiquinone oxidoreductase subunit 5 (subunit L)/multisubunit Na+/H+ antiporter MnhA subunit